MATSRLIASHEQNVQRLHAQQTQDTTCTECCISISINNKVYVLPTSQHFKPSTAAYSQIFSASLSLSLFLSDFAHHA